MLLARRHLRLFFYDPSNWIILLISVFVILSLYFLFIRDFTLLAITDLGVMHPDLELFVDLLMVSGLLVVIGATSCLPICSVFVKDKENGNIRDFLVSPISKGSIYFSYILASTLISILISLLVFVFILIFFYKTYTFYLPLPKMIAGIGILILSSMLSSTFLLTCTLFFRSMTSFGSFGNLFGVVIGFFTGVYIPIGYYPQSIQNGLFMFPLAQVTSMLRGIFTESTINGMTQDASIKNMIESMFGLNVKIGNLALSISQQYLFLFVVFISLLIILQIYALGNHSTK